MADSEHGEESRSLRRSILGCIGCGGLGVLGTFLAAAVVIGAFSTQLDGCDLSTDPGKGTASKRLSVTVTPATQLTDGAEVRVTSSAFAKRTVVGIAVCLREADTKRQGVDACDRNQGYRFATDEAGRLDAPFPVPRVITVGGMPYDCAASARRCLVVAANAGDFDESGGVPLTFRSGLPPADMKVVTSRPQTDLLPIGVQPRGPLTAGAEVRVLASGFRPGEPLLVAWCTDRFATEGPTACEPVDGNAALAAVVLRSLPTAPVATKDGTAVVSIEARATIDPVGDVFSSSEGTTTTSPRTDARFDCRTKPGACSIVITAAADTRRSAVLPYTLATS